jgi:hypothetical protein
MDIKINLDLLVLAMKINETSYYCDIFQNEFQWLFIEAVV